jgi:uncharacterized protein
MFLARVPPINNPGAHLSDKVFDRARLHAESIFACGPYSVHGPDHWKRVEATGLELCRETGADETVVRLFAILHDSCRLDDGADPLHGPRAADMLDEIVGTLFTLEPDRLELLEYAIRHHTGGKISDDPTIGTCWDADRLDLGRVLGCHVPHCRIIEIVRGDLMVE